MKKILTACTLAAGMFAGGSVSAEQVPERYITVKHDGYTLVMDCVARMPLMFQFRLGKDVWNEPHSDNFDFDPKVPRYCQQTRTKGYGSKKGTIYHRGHLVGANAMDNSKHTMEESFYMTNVVPQASEFNRGAWLATEEYQECLREQSDILVVGGVAFNDDTNDYFLRGHSVKTPDLFWKIVITGQGGYYAWIFPNTDEMVESEAIKHMTSIAQIENTIGFSLNLGSSRQLPVSSLPKNRKKCHLG